MKFYALRLLTLAMGGLLAATAVQAQSDLRVWRSGEVADTRLAVAAVKPGLLLAGGRGDVDDAFYWFADLCGGGDVVVLRASGGDGYQDYLLNKIGGFASVTTLLVASDAAAQDHEALRLVAEAEGVFLAGGDQAKYARFWMNSPLGEALRTHVREGKPIGGTSAGLAVLGDFAFLALPEAAAPGDTVPAQSAIQSAEALMDPFDRRVTIGPGIVESPLLANVLTDTHFSQRNRLGRLLVFLARLQLEGHRVRGLGVDEATAVCVEGDGRARVKGAGDAWLVQLTAPAAVEQGKPLEAEARAFRVPTGGEIRFPLLETEGIEPLALRVSAGVLEY